MSDPKHRHYHEQYRGPPPNEDSYQQKDRSRELSQKGFEKKKIFGFQIFIDNDILNDLGNIETFLNNVREEGKVEKVRFNPDLTIPDLSGRNLQIYDKSMEAKYQCSKVLLNYVYQKWKKIKHQTFAVIIFVPEGMVSLLIGTKGHQINKIMKQSKTIIIVNQPINRMTYRTVKIQGHHSDVAKACRIIYEILQEKSTIAYTIEKQPNSLDYTKSKVSIKLILVTGVINYLQNKKKKFIKSAEEQTKCTIRFKEQHNRLLKRDEDMCVVIGRLEDVQAIIILLLTVVGNYYTDQKEGESYTLKMLIPSNYVTKLIGQKGYMIKGISDRSGALIKIQSDKQSEIKECIITIVGSRENKIDATCMILEQIECFKNGGPILQSGKSINENLAQQFKNSLQMRQYNGEEGERFGWVEENHNQNQNEKKESKESKEGGEQAAEKKVEVADAQNLESYDSVLEKKKQEFFQQTSHTTLLQTFSEFTSNHHTNPNPPPPPLIEPPKQDPPEQPRPSTPKQSNEQTPVNNTKLEMGQIKKSKKKYSSSSSLSSHNSQSRSISRSRERRRKNTDKQKEKDKDKDKDKDKENPKEKKQHSVSPRRKRSHSKSRQKPVELKLVVPRKLYYDHKQLRYIEQLSNTEIITSEQRLETEEGVLTIRGSINNNNQCMRLLMKRLARYYGDKKMIDR